jgi:hypothetical protein
LEFTEFTGGDRSILDFAADCINLRFEGRFEHVCEVAPTACEQFGYSLLVRKIAFVKFLLINIPYHIYFLLK